MKIGGGTSFLILALASMTCTCSAIFFNKDDDEDKPSLLKPKTFTIFSRPGPHADKSNSPGLIPHLGSVLHGGSIGIEFHPLKPLGLVHGIFGQAKKVIPGSTDTMGHPSHKEPPKNDHWDEGRDWEYEKPKKEAHKEWKPEEEKPVKHKPDKPAGSSWDDIGENPEDYSTEVPIEDIIQPRLRPKRFIESKIYHVPLLYRSNGRPYQVKIKRRNDLDESKVERND
ncbi:uncharacterized protein LOC129988436 isoform X1 [Argiope bruennichi]|uniref:uncharacterized protein LOC129988436 isoform X1 n=1 Tax=Argiope bruennichi TaxID=94029 RepID=UPI0024945C87|nr:uncharacterized protein LOC129988436 isoform X1 [Argiope bruennichi]